MSTTGYRRHLGLFSATMLIAGSMIGSGVFSVSTSSTRETAPTHHRQPRPEGAA
jgi:amino acid transporter